MSGLFVGTQMIRTAETRGVRELAKGGVQAEVCLGASSRHGSAVMTFRSNSPAVQRALTALKKALIEEAAALFSDIQGDRIDGQGSG